MPTFAQVALEHAPPNDKLYANPAVRHAGDRQFQFHPRLLEAAAQSGRHRARHAGAGGGAAMAGRCRQAARPRTARSCTPRAGASSPMARWRTLPAAQTPPKDVPLKDPKDFTLIGKPLKRLDTPDKVNGKAVYGIDAMLPGMKFATLAAWPVFGGKVGNVDDSAAKKIPGVQQGRRAGRSGRRGRRSHVGGQEGPRGARSSTGTKAPNAHVNSERHLGRSARRQREGRRRRQDPRAMSPRAWPTATGSKRLMSCRSWRTPRWSR